MFTYYERKCIVFWQNLRSWQKIYTPPGHGAHDKFQLCQQDDCHKEHHQQDHHHGRHDLQKNNKINTGKEATTQKITMFKTWDSNLLCRCSIDQTEMMILPPTRKTLASCKYKNRAGAMIYPQNAPGISKKTT